MNLSEYHICFGDIYYHPLSKIDNIDYTSEFVCHLDTALTLHDVMIQVQRYEHAQQEKAADQ